MSSPFACKGCGEPIDLQELRASARAIVSKAGEENAVELDRGERVRRAREAAAIFVETILGPLARVPLSRLQKVNDELVLRAAEAALETILRGKVDP